MRKEINRQIRFCEDELIKCGRTVTSRIYRFSDFKQNVSYIGIYENIVNLFNTDNNFKNSCLKMSMQALQSKKNSVNTSVEITKEALEYAAQYVLAELPFFLNANPIINTQETLMAYHEQWELGEKIATNKFDLKMSKHQGYIILTERGNHYVKRV